MDLIIASNNKNKIKEIVAILGDSFENIFTLKDKGIDIEIIEDGSTFFDNALIKARTICKLTGIATFADDSGLMVEALDGAPGVYSARYAGEPCNDYNNNVKLLQALHGVKNRRAKFVSSLVIYYPDDSLINAECDVSGEITEEPMGDGGFGYDCLFYSKELKQTFAEASADAKNAISHRAKAIKMLLKKCKDKNIK